MPTDFYWKWGLVIKHWYQFVHWDIYYTSTRPIFIHCLGSAVLCLSNTTTSNPSCLQLHCFYTTDYIIA